MKIKTNKALWIGIGISFFSILSSCQKDEEILPNQKDSSIIDLHNPISESKDSLINKQPEKLNNDTTVVENKDSVGVIVTTPEPLPESKPAPEEQKDLPVSASAYKVEAILPQGYVKDGSVDYTDYIQKAINQHSELIFPDFPVMVNDKGLKIPSNRKIYFLEGSEIRLKPSSKGTYTIIHIRNVSNVTLYNPYIIGDRYAHKGTSGEWGNGIGIYSSSNVTISGAKIVNCWGDGIYLGTSGNGTNKNVKLNGAYLKSNRRAGISITDADGLQITSVYAGYSDGTAPFCGINIEPNNEHNVINNITITDPITEKNTGNGIQFVLSNLYGQASTNLNVDIIGHKDVGSFYALKIGNRKPDSKGDMVGSINIKNPVWLGSEDRPFWMSQTDPKLKVYISKPKITPKAGTTASKLSSVNAQLDFGLKKDSSPFILTM